MTTVPQLSASEGKPNYATLIDPKDSARQMRCLAEAIYFESRSEPEEGQAAVAQVVLNRVRSGIYPTTVCGVVYQDRNRPFACQFTFACEGKSLRIEEPGPWAVATRIAQDVVSGANYDPKVDVAVNYHANYVAPFWVGYLKQGRPHRRPHLLRHARRRELGARRAQRPRRPPARRQLILSAAPTNPETSDSRASAADRDWVADAVRLIEADFNRSADTHLIRVDLPRLAAAGIDLYLKDKSTHPSGSLKHRLARSLFLYGLCNGWIRRGRPVVESSSGSTAISEAYFARLLGLPFVAVAPRTTARAEDRGDRISRRRGAPGRACANL